MSLHTEWGSEWAEVVAGVCTWFFSQNIFSLRESVQEVWRISQLSYLVLSRIPLLNTFRLLHPAEYAHHRNLRQNRRLCPQQCFGNPFFLVPCEHGKQSSLRADSGPFHTFQSLGPFAQHTQCNDRNRSCWMHLLWGSSSPPGLPVSFRCAHTV